MRHATHKFIADSDDDNQECAYCMVRPYNDEAAQRCPDAPKRDVVAIMPTIYLDEKSGIIEKSIRRLDASALGVDAVIAELDFIALNARSIVAEAEQWAQNFRSMKDAT